MTIDWNQAAFQVRSTELMQRAFGLSKLRALEWRKEMLKRGDYVSSSQLTETRRDLAQCALGELWERFNAKPSNSLVEATDRLEAMQLRFLAWWGQPEREEEPPPYVPLEAYDHFTPLQQCLLRMAVCKLSDSEQLKQLGRSKGGRQMRELHFQQLEALANAIAVCDLAIRVSK